MAPREIDRYLAALDEPKRSTLEAVRTLILELLPEAEQCISYGMPAFKVQGKAVAGFAAFKNHLSYLPHSGSVLPMLPDDIAPYESSKGALRFSIDKPLPKRLVKKLIITRLRELGLQKATSPMKTTSGSKEGKGAASPSQLIDARIKELSDWRGDTLARLRVLIKQADPEVVEEWKWRGVPVWEHAGIICTGETYKSIVKLTFAKGASLDDPTDLFNSSLEGNTRRAIDVHEGDKIDEKAFKTLIRAAVTLNASSAAKRPATKR